MEHGLARVTYKGDEVTAECLCGALTATFRVPPTPDTDTPAATGDAEAAATAALAAHIEAES